MICWSTRMLGCYRGLYLIQRGRFLSIEIPVTEAAGFGNFKGNIRRLKAVECRIGKGHRGHSSIELT